MNTRFSKIKALETTLRGRTIVRLKPSRN